MARPMVECSFDEVTRTYRTPGGIALPGVTSRLRLAGCYYEFEGSNQEALERGIRVHAALQYDAEGELDEGSVEPSEWGYIEAGRKARRELGMEILKAEYAVGAPEFGYATKVDALAIWRGKKTVVNWKTGGVYRVYALQSALEALLFSPESVERLGIHVQDDGNYKTMHYTDRADYKTAKAVLSVSAWREKK